MHLLLHTRIQLIRAFNIPYVPVSAAAIVPDNINIVSAVARQYVVNIKAYLRTIIRDWEVRSSQFRFSTDLRLMQWSGAKAHFQYPRALQEISINREIMLYIVSGKVTKQATRLCRVHRLLPQQNKIVCEVKVYMIRCTCIFTLGYPRHR